MRMDSGNPSDARRGSLLTNHSDNCMLHMQHKLVPTVHGEERE